MRMHAKESNLPGGTWTPPLVGVVGTVAGILFAFARIGTEPEWTTALQAVGFSLAVTMAVLLVLSLAVRSRD
jgi:biopolymer transport protein ExbB/TolQ